MNAFGRLKEFRSLSLICKYRMPTRSAKIIITSTLCGCVGMWVWVRVRVCVGGGGGGGGTVSESEVH